MYAEWTANRAQCAGNKNKYFPLMGDMVEIGTVQRNGFSSPLYSLDGQPVAVRNFGQNKTSAPKIQKLIEAEAVTITGGPCLFSRSELGFLNKENQFCSLAIPKERKNFSMDIVSLKIGQSVTRYHELHLSYLVKAINKIKEITHLIPNIRLLIPCIEYMAYIPDSWPNGIKNEYWEQVLKGADAVEKYYRKTIEPLGDLEIIRKVEWDVPINGSNEPRDVRSYIKSYTEKREKGLVVAVEDLAELPLVVNAGKNMPWLIGMLGVLSSSKDLFEKEEEIHPYFL